MLLMSCETTRATLSAEALNTLRPIRTCQEAPPIPTGEYTQREVAEYIVRLEGVHRDCEGNLRAVDKFLRTLESE